uniref:Uncharacterized protein n=1 Tax=Solanum tuberosum TaxID=4113 RepID=M1AMV1_SOLTU
MRNYFSSRASSGKPLQVLCYTEKMSSQLRVELNKYNESLNANLDAHVYHILVSVGCSGTLDCRGRHQAMVDDE